VDEASYCVAAEQMQSRTNASADVTVAAVPQHALEPSHSHLYSIPREEPSARVTIALGEPDDNGWAWWAIRFMSLHSNVRLLSDERLRVTDC
jgi:hypothetical protein